MNKKDIAELKRRFHQERGNITCIRGCYVDSRGEVITAFSRSLVNMGQEEAEKYLSIFRRTLSGTQGQNLIDIDFAPQRLPYSTEHQLLTALKDEALRNDDTVEAFFQRLIPALGLEENCLILLMHDGYDLPARARDEDGGEERSGEVFHYILCSVCPVRLTKPVLSYDAARMDFCSKDADWAVGAPEMGFLFPAFEERAANIYQALFYTRDTAEKHDELIRAVFGEEAPMPAEAQKEVFQAILQETLREDCSLEVMQAVHDQVMEKMEGQKADKRAEPLKLTKYDVSDALLECGVSPDRAEAFSTRYDQEFGSQAKVSAVNLVSPRQFEVRMPSVVIKVDSGRTDLVETRMIDGHPYILIRADEGVEVNGVSVNV